MVKKTGPFGLIQFGPDEEETQVQQTVADSNLVTQVTANTDKISQLQSDMDSVFSGMGVIDSNIATMGAKVGDVDTKMALLDMDMGKAIDAVNESTRQVNMLVDKTNILQHDTATAQAYGARGAVSVHEFAALATKYDSILRADGDALAASINGDATKQGLQDIYNAIAHIRSFMAELKGIVDRKEAGIPVP